MSFSYNQNNGFATPFYNSYNGYSQAIPTPAQNLPMPPKTTKIYVTSEAEAMARQAEPNSEMPYFHQNGKVLYNVFTDAWGRKQLQVFNLVPYTEAPPAECVSKTEFAEYVNRLEKIEAAMTAKQGVTDEQ